MPRISKWGQAFGEVEATKPCVAACSIRELDRHRCFVFSFAEVLVFFFLFGRFTELGVVSCLMMMQRIAVSKPNHVWKEILMYMLFAVPISLVASCSLVRN